MDSSENIRRGSCLCGVVSFTFTLDPEDVWFCHCGQCRKSYGMYGAFLGGLRESFTFTGSAHMKAYSASEVTTRTHCDTCGSPITWNHEGYPRLYVLAGLVNGEVGTTSGKHIFVKDKGDYYPICDGLPQYDIVPEDE